MRKVDLTGQRFGRLKVISEGEKLPGNRNRRWICKCDCGKEVVAFGANLKTGHTKSCGCMLSDFDKAKNGTHGKTSHRLYRIWSHMKERCGNPNSKFYRRYGGRGIKVCQMWMDSFEAFYTWATSSGYQDDLTIDRIDNDGNYEPENCRWVTQKAQNNNTRQNVMYTINGTTKTQREWEETIGIRRGTLWKVKKSGRSVEDYIKVRLGEQI